MSLSRWGVGLIPFLATTLLRAISTPEAPSSPLTPAEKHEYKAWFTGSLLSGAGHTVPAQHVNVEPYLFATGYIGAYNDHWHSVSAPHSVTVTPLLAFTYGLTHNADFMIVPQIHSSFQEHASDTRIGDFPLFMGFQTLRDRRGSWTPDLRVVVKSIFPTGHYQHLNPHKHTTDATGLGAYQGGAALNFQKIFYCGIRLLRIRLNLDYLVPSRVHVEGFNTYGGGYGTFGTVRPGHFFTSILAFEYTLSQNWIAALDVKYDLIGSTRFSGTPGVLPSGAVATVGGPSKQFFSLAPAMEYAFNSQVGLIAGVWFTVAGKNSARFVSGVIALNYYH